MAKLKQPSMMLNLSLISLQMSPWAELLNNWNTPPCGHSFSLAQQLMADAPALQYHSHKSFSVLKMPIPHGLLWNQSVQESIQNSIWQAYKDSHDATPTGISCLCKPCPSQWGSPWIYGQIIDNTVPCSYSVNMGNIFSASTEPSCVKPLHLNTSPSNVCPFHWCNPQYQQLQNTTLHGNCQ